MDIQPAVMLWYWVSTLLLAGLLYYPVSKLIWIVRVRGLERRLGRASDDDERSRERRRARLIGGVLSITFAFLFNGTLFQVG